MSDPTLQVISYNVHWSSINQSIYQSTRDL